MKGVYQVIAGGQGPSGLAVAGEKRLGGAGQGLTDKGEDLEDLVVDVVDGRVRRDRVCVGGGVGRAPTVDR